MPKPKRDLLTLANHSQDDIYQLLSRALEFKRLHRSGVAHRLLEGRNIALIFKKPSTRTRISFEAAATHLGAHPIYLTPGDLQLGRGETIEDTARVLSRYVDAIVMRTFAQEEVEALARAATVPVINALTDAHHPCQALADLMTILEKKDRLASVNVAYIGDGNNVCHSLLIAAAKVGINLTAACPAGYEPQPDIVDQARALVRGRHKLVVTDQPASAAKGADVLYTDVWASMGQEGEAKERQRAFAGFQVNEALLKLAHPGAIVMHCLPAHRGQEITTEVLEGPQSVVLDQAENRLHVQKALLTTLIS